MAVAERMDVSTAIKHNSRAFVESLIKAVPQAEIHWIEG
jgi:hypothetical protein